MEKFTDLFTAVTCNNFEDNSLPSDENIFVLCNNYKGSGWKAVAIWTHKPTKEDILKVGLFKENPDRNIEQVIIDKILQYNHCRLNFKGYNKPGNLDYWIEYMIVHPNINGDLELFDYLQTGYCDFNKDYNIYEENYIK